MVKHSIRLTPLNTSYKEGMNNFVVWDKGAYEDAGVRAILCKSPDESWFKMKSVTATPYLEPVFYGLRSGDKVTVSFDALSLVGENRLYVSFLRVTEAYDLPSMGIQFMPHDLESHFSHYRVPVRLTMEPSDLGILLNIRPQNVGGEVIIKNVKVEIETSNERFGLCDQVVRYNHVGDYLTFINTYSGTDINTDYRTIKTLYSEGSVEFPDERTIAFTGSQAGRFRGLMAMLAGSRYKTPVAIYLEYRNTNSVTGFASYTRGYDGFGSQTYVSSTPLPIAEDWTKRIIYLQVNEARSIVSDVGRVSFAINVQLRNVHFSAPRFDDDDKRGPNRLEDLYSDLGVRLLGV